MCTMEFYSTVKKSEIMNFADNMDGTRKDYIERGKPDPGRQVLHVLFHLKFLTQNLQM